MFARILIWCCSLAIVFSAPLNSTTSTRRPESTTISSLPNIDLPDSIVDKSKYELLGGGFQGDMIFPKGYDPSSPNKAKGVAALTPRRWPYRIIPYDISAITLSSHQTIITNAMNTLMYAVGTPIPGQTSRRTCVYFRPKNSQDRTYFRIIYGGGCSATVGYWANYVSTMTLNNPGCFYSGTIQHELMHVLGFNHEQSRPDRDSYITVNYANIQNGMSHNFEKLQWGVTALSQNTPYDYGSIMHYPSTAFSVNGRPTIVPKRSNVVLGQRQALSATDIAEIRNYYGC